MSNYINDAHFDMELTKMESRYSMCEEKKQNQWINQVAKQAAKLISGQIKESNNQSKNSK